MRTTADSFASSSDFASPLFAASAAKRRYPTAALSVLAALCLSACGGGGGGGGATSAAEGQSATSPSASVATAVVAGGTTDAAPAQAAEFGPGAVQVNASTTAQPNTRYDVNAAAGTVVDVVLPSNPRVGDFVSVRGSGSGQWRLVPGWSATATARARTYPQAITTANLIGNAAAGQAWNARMEPRAWQWITTEQEGSVLVAADGGGQLHVSTDAGVTWSATNSPTADWASAAAARMTWENPSGAAGQVSIVAVARGGGMYRFSGGSWSPVTAADPLVDLTRAQWESVAVNEGGGITAAVFNGPLYQLTHGGGISAGTADGSSTALVRGWRGVARGTGLVAAVNEEGEVWVSSGGGNTWSLRNVVVNGTPVRTALHRVAVSADGSTIAVAGRSNSALYVSRDQGLSWSQTAAPVADYTALAVSADGQVIGATLAGGAQLSRDGGASFTALTLPGTGTQGRAITMSADGNMLAVAAGAPGAPAQLYTSLGNRTSYASAPGAIVGKQNDFVEVEYLGNMRYSVRQSSGGPFTIR